MSGDRAGAGDQQAEIDRLRGLIHGTCATFGHLWPDPKTGFWKWVGADAPERCVACGVFRRCVDQEVEHG